MTSEEDSSDSGDSRFALHPPHELDLSELSDEEAKAFFLEGRRRLKAGRQDRSVLGKRTLQQTEVPQEAKPQRKTREAAVFALFETRTHQLAAARLKYSVRHLQAPLQLGDVLWRKQVVVDFVAVRARLHTPKPVMIVGNAPQAAAQSRQLLGNKSTFAQVFRGALKLSPQDSLLRELVSSGDDGVQAEVLLRWVLDLRTSTSLSDLPALTQWQAKWIYALCCCLLPPYADDTHALVVALFHQLIEESALRVLDSPQSAMAYDLLLTVLVNCMLTPDTW